MELRMQYAMAADGVRIAFAVAGSGPYLVRTPGMPFSHCQLDWRDSAFYEQLTKLATVVPYDGRGTGLSERDPEDLSLDARVGDIEAVVDHLGLERFALHGVNFSGPPAITYAVRHPERVSHLILDDAFFRTADVFETTQNRAFSVLVADWEAFTESVAWAIRQQDRADTQRYAEFLRACVSRETAVRIYAAVSSDDVTDLLSRVSAPTLVLQHDRSINLRSSFGQELAANIPGAELVTMVGGSIDDTDTVLHAIGRLLGTEFGDGAGRRMASGVRAVLFTDVVGHTEMMQRLGDAKGREVLREHERITRTTLGEHAGAEVKTMGDGFMASFGSVTQALECAIALQRAFALHNESVDEPVHVRVGLNAGEPIEEDGDLFGSTVILAARIAAKAGADEILTSVAVRELCAGKGFLFADRGESALRGFEDPVRMFEVRWQT